MSQPLQPQVIELADFENSKENIKPLTRGRDPKVLSKLFSSESENKKKLLHDLGLERQNWELKLKQLDGDADPLSTWSKYIQWTEENFPSEGRKSALLPLLERCTSEFKDSPQYRNDLRYVHVWIRFAHCVDDPTEIYKYMEAKSIGEYQAAFYEGWAMALEHRKMFKQALNVFQKGLDRNAMPYGRLLRHKREFEARAAAISRKQQSGEDDETEAQDENGGRRPLGMLSSRGGRGSTRTSRGLGSGIPRPSAVLSSGAHQNTENSNSGFQIYQSPSAGGHASASAPSEEAPAESEPSFWQHLGSELDKHKENRGIADKWTNVKFPQKAHSSKTSAKSSIPIYVEPEFSQSSSGGDISSETTAKKGGSRLSSSSRSSTSLSRSKSRSSKQKRPEVSAYDKSALLNEHGEEMSFEECRAFVYFRRFPLSFTVDTSEDHEDVDMEECSSEESDAEAGDAGEDEDANSSADLQADFGNFTSRFNTDLEDITISNAGGDLLVAAAMQEAEREEAEEARKQGKHTPPSPVHTRAITINTKAALEDVFEMFRAPLGCAEADAQEDEATDEDVDGEDDSEFDSLSLGMRPPQGGYVAAESAPPLSSIAAGGGRPSGGFQIYCDDDDGRNDVSQQAAPTATQSAATASFPIFCDEATTNGASFQIFCDGADSSAPAAANQAVKIFSDAKSSQSSSGPSKGRAKKRPALRPRSEPAASHHLDAPDQDEDALDQFFNVPLGSQATCVSDSLAELFGAPSLGGGAALSIDTFLAMNSEQMTTPMRERSVSACAHTSVPSAAVVQLGVQSHWIELEARAMTNLQAHSQVFDETLGKEPRLSSLKAAAKARRLSSITSTMNLTDHLHLSGGKSLMVYGKIGDELLPGSGGMSTFYMVDRVDASDRTVSLDEQCKRLALRMDVPRTAWEFYIHQQLLCRLPGEHALARARLGKLHSLHLYKSRSFLILEHSSHGTLENMVNLFKAKKRSARAPLLPEALVMFYAIELLRIVHAAHSVGVIHGSIACKNLLILAKESSSWGHWQPAMVDGWEDRGLSLINWSQSVDTTAYPASSTFQYGEEEPWSFNRDAEQICDVVHQLLFGEPLSGALRVSKDGQRSVASTFHSSWANALWSGLFRTLLNADKVNVQLDRLLQLRKDFEQYLVDSPLQLKRVKQHVLKSNLMMLEQFM